MHTKRNHDLYSAVSNESSKERKASERSQVKAVRDHENWMVLKFKETKTCILGSLVNLENKHKRETSHSDQ